MSCLRVLVAAFAITVPTDSNSQEVNERCFHDVGCWSFARYGEYVDVSFISETDEPISSGAAVSSSSRTYRFRIASNEKGPHYAGQFPFPTQSVITWTIVLFAGTERAEYDSDYVYDLPFGEGTEARVTQAYDGPTTHQAEHFYSIDFAMAVGTLVHVARSGEVVLAIDGPCANSSGSNCPNVRVDLRHEDGTFASYQHLQPGSLQANVGERLKTGQLIARSGTSGRSFRPHLHFQVYTPTPNGEYIVESLPTLFRTASGTARLRRSTSYINPPRTPQR